MALANTQQNWLYEHPLPFPRGIHEIKKINDVTKKKKKILTWPFEWRHKYSLTLFIFA